MRKFALLVVLSAGVWAQAPAGLEEFSIEPTDPTGSHHNTLNPTEITADRIALRELLAFAYGVPLERVLGPDWLEDRFQVTARARAGADQAEFTASLQKALGDRFHLNVERNTRDMPVNVLKLVNPDALKSHKSEGAKHIQGSNGRISVSNTPISDFGNMMSNVYHRPVIDETGLAGRFTFDLEWQAGDLTSLAAAMRDQLGIAVSEATRTVPVLLISRM